MEEERRLKMPNRMPNRRSIPVGPQLKQFLAAIRDRVRSVVVSIAQKTNMEVDRVLETPNGIARELE